MAARTLVATQATAPATAILRRCSAEGDYGELEIDEVSDLPAPPESGWMWVDVAGALEPELVDAIGEVFGLHPLPLEDVLDPRQRPKVEEYRDFIFIVLDTLAMSETVVKRRVALFLGERFVISFQEEGDECLEPIRERLRRRRGRLRTSGADYLAYAIIDSIVDHYFPVLDHFDEVLEQREDEVLEARSADAIALSRGTRHTLQTVRHAIWPAREVVATLQNHSGEMIRDDTRVYLRDCYDHLVQLVDMVERSREISANLLELYISKVSLETNRAMKVLTVIATIFIPLTFITGVYGMNFSGSPLNMPELRWYWGYPFALGLMLVTALALLWFFKRRRWF